MKSAVLGLAACAAAGLSGTCWADDLKATKKFTDTVIGFDPGGSYSNYTLTIAGPNGIHASASSRNSVPSIDLKRIGELDDGLYTYQMTASTDEKIPVRSRLDNGRSSPIATSMLKVVSTSGQFEIKGGTIVKVDPNAREEQKRQR
jgi:hypothetical protein